MKQIITCLFAFVPICLSAQIRWQNVDTLFQPLPASVHVFYTNDSIDGKPNIAYYVVADLADKQLDFTTQVGNSKRYTPTQYFEQENHPLLVMNCTFFEFVHNSNLNLVVKDGRMMAYQLHTVNGRGKDTLTYRHHYGSAIGINKKRKADVAWLYTDSSATYPYATQEVIPSFKDSVIQHSRKEMLEKTSFKKWKMKSAVGGGPVLLQNGDIKITNKRRVFKKKKALLSSLAVSYSPAP